MANIKSAKKRILTTAKKTEANTARRSRIRTFIKRVVTAIEAGNATEAKTALLQAQPEIDRGVSKGILKKNTAARKMSRLSATIKALSAK
jgi:small subunit ribosomal protein S20